MSRARTPNVYLAGMIGTGKTTIGQALAKELGRPFLDFDWELKSDTGLDLHALVRERGWLGFRVAEYETIKRLAALDGVVVGLGGGTVRYPWNLDALAGTGPIVLLTASLDVLAERVRASDRPRVNEGTTLEEDLELIWRNGKDMYLKAATFTYPTDRGLTVEQEAAELARRLDLGATGG